MKKLFNGVVVVMMVLAMMLAFTACNEPEVSGDDFPEALQNVETYEIADVSDTGWTLSGGMINGVEMEEADLLSVLEACGGTFEFLFLSQDNVMMVNGNGAYEGKYEIINDGQAIKATFEGYTYFGVFTIVSGEQVLIVVNSVDSEKALYMTQIQEG